MRRKIVIGNWKLHGSQAFVSQLLRSLTQQWVGVHRAEVVVCPSFVHLAQAYGELAHSNIGLGSQDVSYFDDGAYTGDVSAEMLHDIGCHYAICGHSERRRYHRESDDVVAKKFAAAQKARLVPILCVGESEQEREQGNTIKVIDRQIKAVVDRCGVENLSRAIVAYEPLWAVGTGKHASPTQAEEVQQFIRSEFGPAGRNARVVYGGSVTPSNAAEYFAMPDIDGVLVGGAALKAPEFLDICRAAE